MTRPASRDPRGGLGMAERSVLVNITIFSVPKPFVGHIGTIQRNAITSWTRLSPRPEVILLGGEEGVADLVADLGVRHLKEIQRNVYGTPLLSSLFEIANASATHETLCYVNADIILLSDFTKMTARIGRRRCVVVGRRTDLDLSDAIDFADPHWEARLRARLARDGRLHGPRAHDYFLFSRRLFDQVPPFAIGRRLLDNWLVHDARRRGLRVVDATRAVTAIHQNHGFFGDLRLPNGGWNWDHPEAKHNLALAGGHPLSYNIADCTHVLRPSGIWPAIWPEYLRQRLQRPPFLPSSPGLRPRLMRLVIVGVLRGQGLLGRLRRMARQVVRFLYVRTLAAW